MRFIYRLSFLLAIVIGAQAVYAQSISPASVTLTPSQTQTFIVQNPGKTLYTWALYPSTGTISVAGVYTAPASISLESTVTIYAEAANLPTLTATVTLMPNVSISVAPTSISLTNGQSAPFVATVTGTTNTAYTWSTPSYGTLDSSGNYTVPMTLNTPQTVYITATSVEDPTKTASSTVTLLPTISVALNPTSTSLTGGQTTALNGVVYGTTNTGINWSMSPQVGTLSNGNYTAPSPVPSAENVTITATSQAASSRSASVTLSLVPVAVSLTASSTTVTAGQSVTLDPTVTGSSDTSVSWTISPAVGSISNGVYTAPSSVATAENVTITATSAADPTKSASTVITVKPGVTISLTPSSASLEGGQSTTFKATVAGSSNTTVNWSMSPSAGTLNAGVYTAPATIASAETVTVTATSAANTAISASATISLVPVSITISPTTASLAGGQSTTFTARLSGTTNASVSWSMSPSVGTLSNGVYTAPATITSAQTVTVTATSAADSTKTASAVVSLVPVSVTISPTSVSLSGGQTQQFSASLSGTSNPNVTWSISPSVGSISSSGLYAAPQTITAQQTVTITAVSAADTTKSASATITLLAPTTLAITPSSVSLTGGQSAQFSVTLGGTATTAVTWSLSPSVGTITNGVYTAPSTIASQQTITLTVTSTANSSQTAQATITLNTTTSASPAVSPTTASLSASQTQQFTAANLGTNPAWTISPETGSISTSGLYTAPSSISAQTTVTVTATNASNSAQSATATVTLNPPAASSSTTITLPLEVIGPNGYTVSASFNIPSGSSTTGLTLSMQIHGLRTQTQASVQLNNAGWQAISEGNVTLLGQASAYGGIGGGFHTISMTMPIPNGTIQTGTNTITFEFNQTDGRVSGFRVLAFNINDSSGNALIAASSFVQDDPNTWQPPSTAASDIAAGLTLYQTASLTVPSGGSTVSITAHCSDCHTIDGRDLKYFNYSNNSIQTRAVFHGLTAQQGAQIASYIRSLNYPNPGMPWNPPYQPGPGLDSQPVEDWAAGAGLSAVVASDQDALNQLFSGGITPDAFAATGNLSVRETVTQLQMPDWNSWLPTTYPGDAWSDFTSSAMYGDYVALRANLVPNGASAYVTYAADFLTWGGNLQSYLLAKTPSSSEWTTEIANEMYSLGLWSMVKDWELNQDFGLEGMAQSVYTAPGADARAWYGHIPFLTSPVMMQIPQSVGGLDNGSVQTYTYIGYMWWHLQLILNNGNKQQSGDYPIDWEYVYAQIQGLAYYDSPGQTALLYTWLIKALQVSNNGNGPNATNYPWTWYVNDLVPQLYQGPGYESIWTGASSTQQTALYQGYVTAYLNVVTGFTPQQFYAGGWASATEVPNNSNPWANEFAARVWYAIPVFRQFGVSQSLINEFVSWAQAVWPAVDWSPLASATCVDGSYGYSCSTEQ